MKKISLACAMIPLLISGLAQSQEFPLLKRMHHPSKPALVKNTNHPVNFSGEWIGQCNDDPQDQILMNIEQDEYTLKISYPDMDYASNEFEINGLQTSQEASNLGLDSTTYFTSWDVNNTSLILHALGSYYYSPAESFSSIFTTTISKITLSLEGDKLMASGEAYVLDTPVLAGNHLEKLSCEFHKKSA